MKSIKNSLAFNWHGASISCDTMQSIRQQIDFDFSHRCHSFAPGHQIGHSPGQVHRSESFIDLAAIVVALGRFILGWIPDTMYIPDTETSDPE